MSIWKLPVKRVLAEIPKVAEVYQRWWAAGATPPGGYSLDRLADRLPGWVGAVAAARRMRSPEIPTRPRRVLVFGYLQWWLEHAVALALLLRADGHRVDLAYLPQRRWQEDPTSFDLQRQNAYLQQALAPLSAEIRVFPLQSGAERLPADLTQTLESLSHLDVQYTFQREEIDWQSDREARALLALRRSRNRRLGSAAYRLLRRAHYDAVVIPNGSVLEFGALFRTVQSLGQLSVTYEFGERRQHLWLAQRAEVMRLPTQALWKARGVDPLESEQRDRLEQLFQARRSGRSWDHFSRQWQRGISTGAQVASQRLGLDPDRPVVLLCTNVVGDSLALDRQVFTRGMSDWLVETVQMLAGRASVQLIVRVHPGEILGAGHPSAQLVRSALPELPAHITLVPPDSQVNTYDLIELAQLGLVYTTTVGLEMAMFGVPVIVAGNTHYRDKGFTHDPQTMGEYRRQVDELLRELPVRRLPHAQVELAWQYAYRFFFEYPFPYPWHLLHFWEDLGDRPLEEIVLPAGREPYSRTLRALTGEPVDWKFGSGGMSKVDDAASPAERAQVGR